MTLAEEPVGDEERSLALAGWVAAFDREMVQSGDFAGTVAVMSANGCFDVRGVVERWILTNPTSAPIVAAPAADPWETVLPQAAFEEAPELEEVPSDREPEPTPLRAVDDLSPDIAHFLRHSVRSRFRGLGRRLRLVDRGGIWPPGRRQAHL